MVSEKLIKVKFEKESQGAWLSTVDLKNKTGGALFWRSKRAKVLQLPHSVSAECVPRYLRIAFASCARAISQSGFFTTSSSKVFE